MLTMNPPGVSTNNYDHTLLIGLTAVTNVVNNTPTVSIVPQSFGSQAKALTTGLFGPAQQPILVNGTNYHPPQYITVVQDDPAVPGSKVQMFVIQVGGGPYLGSLAVIPGNNAFDQRLTLRHTDDFGGNPEGARFEWYYFPGDTDPSQSPGFPILNPDGSVQNPNGWFQYPVPDVSGATGGAGANDLTLGLGGESGLLTMSDNWFISRYAGYTVDGNTNWSGWVGAAGGGEAQFAPGWIQPGAGGAESFCGALHQLSHRAD